MIAAGRRILAEGLRARHGRHLSVRVDGEPDAIAMTPTSLAYDALEPDDICIVATTGELRDARRAPTSELPLHLLVYAHRPEVGAIVHTHSPAAMTLAVLGSPRRRSSRGSSRPRAARSGWPRTRGRAPRRWPA